ncbi:MAG: radical SAM protein [Bacillota bacterium]|nr:radical SAM protein [Bacillota bacterium]
MRIGNIEPLNFIKTPSDYPVWLAEGKAWSLLPGDHLMVSFPAEAAPSGDFESILKEAGFMNPLRVYSNEQPLKEGLVLTVTYRCNQHCVYCDSPTDVKKSDVDNHIIDATVEMAARYSDLKGYMDITFYGGEPTLRPDLIERTLWIMEMSGIPYRTSIATNGSCSEEALNRILNHNINFRVSLDMCTENLHDRMRGKSSFNTAVSAIKKIVQRGKTVTPRVTVTSENVGMMREIAAFCKRLGCKGITFAPVKSYFGSSVESKALIPGAEEYVQNWFEAQKESDEKFSLFKDIYSYILNGNILFFCPSLHILPDGLIVPGRPEARFVPEYSLGYVQDRQWTLLEERAVNMKRLQRQKSEKHCKGCLARTVCNGNTMMAEISLDRPIKMEENLSCRIVRLTLSEILARIFKTRKENQYQKQRIGGYEFFNYEGRI